MRDFFWNLISDCLVAFLFLAIALAPAVLIAAIMGFSIVF